MLYSVPYEYIKKKVEVRITDHTVEIFYKQNRIASHPRLKGRKGQYSTIEQHMPENHSHYQEWNGDRFRRWAEKIGPKTLQVTDAILGRHVIEQQGYRSCMGLLRLSEKYSDTRLEAACQKALTYTNSPSYRSVSNILAAGADQDNDSPPPDTSQKKTKGITRGAAYYRR